MEYDFEECFIVPKAGGHKFLGDISFDHALIDFPLDSFYFL